MSNAATRLITLIMLLQRRPNQKAAELAAQQATWQRESGQQTQLVHDAAESVPD